MTAQAESVRPKASEVADLLAGQAEALCRDMLSAGRRNGNYWCVGSIANDKGGSLWVLLRGSRRGFWRDEQAVIKGDMLDLIAACKFAGDKRAAYHWALAYLGFDGSRPLAPVQRPEPAARAAADEAELAARRHAAATIWLAANPVLRDTPAAAYLAGRNIDLAQLGRQPRALRFHPGLKEPSTERRYPAMVAAIHGADGLHLATHRTWLQTDARGRWIKARVEKPKMVLGSWPGGCIRIWRGASGKPLKDAPADQPVVLAEGIETALSVALAVPEMRVLCCVDLGGLGSVALPDQVRTVILAWDNDVSAAPRDRYGRPLGRLGARDGFQRVVDRHLDAGREVRIARAEVGNDFNDTLRAWE